MTEKEKEEFKEFIIQAVQATKRENSGLINDLKNNVISIHEKFDSFRKEDKEWKSDAKPIIDMGKNLRGFSKVILYILYLVGAVFGLLIAWKNYFKGVKW